MGDAIRDALQVVLVRHGRQLLDDRRRCENVLKENCPQAKREIAALIATLEYGVPRRLLGMPAASMTAMMIANYAARVAQDSGLEEGLARWAIETWALGLGLKLAPQSLPPARLSPGPLVAAAHTERIGGPDAGRRTCPFCGASATGRMCQACGRDTTAPRRPCATCGKMVPSNEPACWNCGTAFRSDLGWKIPLIISLFVLAVAATIVMGLLK